MRGSGLPAPRLGLMSQEHQSADCLTTLPTPKFNIADCSSPAQGTSVVPVGSRVAVAAWPHRGAVGSFKVCSSSFVALQLDDGSCVPRVPCTAVERLASVGDRVVIAAGPYMHRRDIVRVTSAQGAAVELDNGKFIPCISRPRLLFVDALG